MFYGTPASISVGPNQRLVGSASASFGAFTNGAAQQIWYDLCYSINGAPLTPFSGAGINFAKGYVTSSFPTGFSISDATQNTSPFTFTYTVGFCVSNVDGQGLALNSSNGPVNGWIMVTN